MSTLFIPVVGGRIEPCLEYSNGSLVEYCTIFGGMISVHVLGLGSIDVIRRVDV